MTEARYETKTMKVLRGTEGRSISKWASQGWELVDQDTGTARSTLTFRKAKRPIPVRALAVGGAAVVVVAGIITGSVLIFGGGDPDPTSTTATATSTSASATSPAVSTPPPPATTTAATASAADQSEGSVAPITQIAVDDLYDALNAPSISGIATGDRFEVTGPLSGADYWGESASGDFFVYLSALGGANDLTIFIDEGQTRGWGDGTQVTFVLEVVDMTINGETTSGWLRAQSAQTL